MSPFRVLFTNLSLSARSGTELFVRDLALELLRRGHAVSVYAPLLGAVADELRAAGARATADLADEPPPDVIHGHHHIETMTAVLRFPGAPAVFVCHDATAWHDRAPLHPRVRGYVAVDARCRDRLAADGAPGPVRVIPNAVDLTRFRPRGPLPPRPRRAALFSHYAAEHTHLPAVRAACARAGVPLDVLGTASGKPCAAPEAALGAYDLVFAKARCALEAMAVGCAVVLCGPEGCGPLVRASAWDELRAWNFGARACTAPLDPERLFERMAEYDATEAAAVRALTRERAGVGATADAFLDAYADAVRAQAESPVDPTAEARAAAEYLRAHLSYPFVNQFAASAAERDHWRASAESAHRGWAELGREYERLTEECRALRAARRAA